MDSDRVNAGSARRRASVTCALSLGLAFSGIPAIPAAFAEEPAVAGAQVKDDAVEAQGATAEEVPATSEIAMGGGISTETPTASLAEDTDPQSAGSTPVVAASDAEPASEASEETAAPLAASLRAAAPAATPAAATTAAAEAAVERTQQVTISVVGVDQNGKRMSDAEREMVRDALTLSLVSGAEVHQLPVQGSPVGQYAYQLAGLKTNEKYTLSINGSLPQGYRIVPVGENVDAMLPSTNANAVADGSAVVLDGGFVYNNVAYSTLYLRVQKLAQSDQYNPAGQDINTTAGKTPDAADGISNKEELPEGTKYEWAKTPDTSKPGNLPGTIKVIYPDGSTEEVKVNINVGKRKQTATVSVYIKSWDGKVINNKEERMKIRDSLTLTLTPEEGEELEVPHQANNGPDDEKPAFQIRDLNAVENYKLSVQGELPQGYRLSALDEITDKDDVTNGSVISLDGKTLYGDQAFTTLYLPVVKIADKDTYEPKDAKNTVDYKADPRPEDSIGNKDELPEGTKYEWAENGKPDTSKANQDVPGKVQVTYPDGSSETIDVTVHVNQAKQDLTIPIIVSFDPSNDQAIDLANTMTLELIDEDGNAHKLAQMDGQNSHQVQIEGLEPGTYTLRVSNIPSDYLPVAKGSSNLVQKDKAIFNGDTIELNAEPYKSNPNGATVRYFHINMKENLRYEPEAQDIETMVGVKLPARNGIANTTYLPNAQYEWETAPDVSKPGKTTGVVKVTYRDGTEDVVTVNVRVIGQNSQFDPKGQDLEAMIGDPSPSADAAISNKDELPTDATYTWKGDAPSTATAGTTPHVVVVTYADGTTDEVTVNVTVKGLNDVNDPKGQDIETTVGGKPDPEDGIGNLDDLPEGTEVTWEQKPDTTKPGDTTGTIKVTYPDGTSDTVDVTVHVIGQNSQFDPKGQDIETTVGGKPDAADGVSNKGDLPEGTAYEWEKTPDTSKPGDSTGTIKVTYPDGTSDTVDVTVHVIGQNEKFEPEGQPVDTKVGGKPSAAEGIKNKDELPEGTEFTWVTDPDTSKSGTVPGTIKVTYPDGTFDLVDVDVKVTGMADEFDPEPKPIETEVGGKPSPEDGIDNLPDLPDGTKVEWEQEPDTSKPGDATGVIRVTYPDGTSETFEVAVSVKAPAKGETKPAVSVKKTKKTRVLPKTGDASLIATLSAAGAGALAGLAGLIKRRRDEE